MIDAETLDAARGRGDAVADGVLQRLGREVWAMNTLMQGCRGNAQALPERLPAAAREFYEQHSVLPAWYQPSRVAAAQRWANGHLLPITTALFHAALPSAYAAERGATVLLATGRMVNDLERRVNETARFVVDVLAPDAFEPHGVAIRAAQQVRLVHAAVRVWLRERPPWPGEVPLNQEDLVGTLLTFSVVVVRGVRRLGVTMTRAETEDFYHLWRVVGWLLGIEEALPPRDFSDAEALADRIARRHHRASPAGQQLMQALLSRIDEHVRLPGMAKYLVRRLAGDHVADLLAVPTDDGFRRTLTRLTRLPLLDHPSLKAALPQLSTLVGKPLFDGIITRKLGGELPGFAAPTSSMLRSQQG